MTTPKEKPMSETETRDVEGLVSRARQVIAFLNGSWSLDSFWFGDRPVGVRGKYWWRSKHLPEIEAALDAQADALRTLREQVERLKGGMKAESEKAIWWENKAFGQSVRADTLQREVEALKADRERLDWLEQDAFRVNGGILSISNNGRGTLNYWPSVGGTWSKQAGTLRDAIDAVRHALTKTGNYTPGKRPRALTTEGGE